MGTVDGPGVRFVLFLQGCPLRCACCHNPDTWKIGGGSTVTVPEMMEKIRRFRPFFGEKGGVTVSGGEALLQEEFVTELFTACHAEGIHTCLDTSGYRITAATPALLAVTDLVLLDVKYATEADYRAYVGGSLSSVLTFLELLEAMQLPTWIRQVIIPTKNDRPEQLVALSALLQPYSCIQKIELLPFHKLCIEKYQALGIPFPFIDLPTPTPEQMAALQAALPRLDSTSSLC